MNFKSIGAATAGALTHSLAAVAPGGAAQSERAEKHVTVDQAIACLKTAVAARQGRVRDLEVDLKDGKTICQVKVVGANGKKVEIDVDVMANKVVRVDD